MADDAGSTRDDRTADVELLEALRQLRLATDPVLHAQILRRQDWIAEACARRFRGRGESPDDLLQVARLGLIKAVARFDPDVSESFVGYAMATVVGELRRYFRDATWMVHVPRRGKETQALVRSAVEHLAQRLGRSPTTAQLSDYLGIDQDLVLEALDAASAYRFERLDAGSARRDSDRAPESTALEDDAAFRDLLARLPERDRAILTMRFSEARSQAEIAENVGLSQVQVSRLLKSILADLRRYYRDDNSEDNSDDNSDATD